jgi:hypothetical protein
MLAPKMKLYLLKARIKKKKGEIFKSLIRNTSVLEMTTF